MVRTIATGEDSFVALRRHNLFYVDKTKFIREWWNGHDKVTLITRPRRFGKTLMLDTVRSFFSPEFAGQTDLFTGLDVWDDGRLRNLQGRIPVVFLSFAEVKYDNYADAIEKIKEIIADLYEYFGKIFDFSLFSYKERKQFDTVSGLMGDVAAHSSLRNLGKYLARQYGNNPIFLLDEYDSPLHEAWTEGYWEDLVGFLRVLFNATFKTNPYLKQGLLTGITRVGKESIFSDMNNLKVVGTTTDLYTDCFGFTEQEVLSAMDEYGLTDMEAVKKWYDGFIFGSHKNIYNPWSIISYLSEKRIAPYWGQTSSNALVGTLIARGNVKVKEELGRLLHGESIVTQMDEQTVFSQLYKKKGAIWSLLMAAGYVKPLDYNLETGTYKISITNFEVQHSMESLISDWFNNDTVDGDRFREALLTDDLKSMNRNLRNISETIFSFFDTGGKEPERFYHAFVLGLIVDLKGRYEITSNRESGDGRYDIMMFPKHVEDHGIVIEFKTIDVEIEKKLEVSCYNALQQIKNKHYINELLNRGVEQRNIYIYGFAFAGKHVLICGGSCDTIA